MHSIESSNPSIDSEAPTVFNAVPAGSTAPAADTLTNCENIYFDNGQLATQRTFYTKTGYPHTERSWYADGAKREYSIYRPTGFKLADYSYRPNGQLDRMVEYDANGTPLDIVHMSAKSGVPASITRMGYNGVVQHSTHFYEDGKTPMARTEYGITGDVTARFFDRQGHTTYISNQREGHGLYMRFNALKGTPSEMGQISLMNDSTPLLLTPAGPSLPPLPSGRVRKWLSAAGAAASIIGSFNGLTYMTATNALTASNQPPVKVAMANSPTPAR